MKVKTTNSVFIAVAALCGAVLAVGIGRTLLKFASAPLPPSGDDTVFKDRVENVKESQGNGLMFGAGINSDAGLIGKIEDHSEAWIRSLWFRQSSRNDSNFEMN